MESECDTQATTDIKIDFQTFHTHECKCKAAQLVLIPGHCVNNQDGIYYTNANRFWKSATTEADALISSDGGKDRILGVLLTQTNIFFG